MTNQIYSTDQFLVKKSIESDGSTMWQFSAEASELGWKVEQGSPKEIVLKSEWTGKPVRFYLILGNVHSNEENEIEYWSFRSADLHMAVKVWND